MKNSLNLNCEAGDLPSLRPNLLIGHLRGRMLAKVLFEGLTRINDQGDAELAGALSVDISPNCMQYRFTLRDHSWSDGNPVTAFQYEKSWKHTIAPQSDSPRADLLYCIKNAEAAKKGVVSLESVGVKALDEKTLLVDLEFPSPYFLQLLAQSIFAPLPDPKIEPIQFNGPFVLDKWEKGRSIQLKPNSHYWQRGHVKLDGINISMINEPMTAIAMYDKGEIDWMGNPLGNLSVETAAHLKDQEFKKAAFNQMFWFYFNTHNPTLSSLCIRKALAIAIDRSLITQHILINGSPLSKPLPISVLSQNSPIEGADLIQAKKLFQEGLAELKLTRDTFPPLTISYSNEANRKQIALYLQEVWQNTFGIKINIQGMEWNVFRSNLEKGQFQIAGCIENMIDRDPLEILQRFEESNVNNFPKWRDEEYQKKISLARREPQLQNRSQLLMEAERILIEQVPFFSICSLVHLYTHHPQLNGYIFDSAGCVDFAFAGFESK